MEPETQPSWVSHHAEVSLVEISSKSKKQTSKTQRRVLGKLSELGRGEECPNRQGMFLIGVFIHFVQFWLKHSAAAVMSASFLQPFLTRWAFQQLLAHWFLVSWYLPWLPQCWWAGRITSLAFLYSLIGGLLSPVVSDSCSGACCCQPHMLPCGWRLSRDRCRLTSDPFSDLLR